MLKEGQILEGKYKLGRLLGRGGMGAVFLGEHTRIKRAVAIKVLHDEKADSENTQRFEREAEAAGRIGSDHIVEVLDFGTTPDGDRFMVMEYLDGETLKERLKRVRRFDPADVVPIVVQVLEGLAAAHAAGIVHRDLKPDNVFIAKSKAGRPDFVKIVDFGISKFNALTGDAGMMTKTGAIMGTPYYMSPEQARATNEVDERSDLYSVGVVLYEAITGAVPFAANTLTELMFKIVFEDPPLPQSLVPSLDLDFAAIVMRSIARDPARRFQSAPEMQAALAGWNVARASRRPGGSPSTAKMAVAAEPVSAIPSRPQMPAPPTEVLRSAPPSPAMPAQREGFLFGPGPPGSVGRALQSAPGHVPPAALYVDAATARALPRPPRVGGTEPLARGVDPTMVPKHPIAPTLDGPVTVDTTKVWNAPGAPTARGRSGAIVTVIVAGLVTIAAALGWFVSSRFSQPARAQASEPTSAASSPAPASAAPSSSMTSAAPSPVVTATARATSLAPEPGLPIDEPTASPGHGRAGEPPLRHPGGAPLRGAAPPHPTGDPAPPPARATPPAAGTVKDFGY